MTDQYTRSLGVRLELGRLLAEGMSEPEAIKIVMQGDSNTSRKIETWKKNDVYPFGSVSGPDGQLPIDISSTTATPGKAHSDLVALIQQIVQKELSQHKPSIEVVRPSLDRKKSNTKMKSFRCPQALWDMADKKAQSQNMSLNGVVESLLFQWLGSPDELLK